MHVLELLGLAQRLISDQGNRVFETPGDLVEHLQVAYERIWGKFASFDIGIGLNRKDYTWVEADQDTFESTYDLPPFFEQIKAVELLKANGKTITLGYPADFVRTKSNTGPYGFVYDIRGRQLVIDTRYRHYDDKPGTVRLYYYRSPHQLAVFKPDNLQEEGSPSTGILDMPPESHGGLGKLVHLDDYYVGAQLECVSGKGVGEVAEVATYDAATRKANFRTGQVIGGDKDSILSVVPAIPERAHPILAYMAAADGARIEENTNAAALLQAEVRDRMEDIERTMSVRQVQASRTINPEL